ncbi:MAG: phosphatidylglycerophosphatase A [Bryobacteraceae bacterium]
MSERRSGYARTSLRIAKPLATWFGCGYVPKGPGTAGSIGAVIVGVLLAHYVGAEPMTFFWLAALFLRPAVWAADKLAEESGNTDPQIVVIDEVIGLWVTVIGATSLNWKSWLLALLLFRIFDIWKPFPVRRLEKLHGGLGIVMDDVMAGVYGALVLRAAGWFNLY